MGTPARSAARIASKLPRPTAAAVALMGMGIRDYGIIGSAVGLTAKEVERIDRADDRAIRQLGSRGIPDGEYFKLLCTIRCPKCNASIRLVPCVACVCRSYEAE